MTTVSVLEDEPGFTYDDMIFLDKCRDFQEKSVIANPDDPEEHGVTDEELVEAFYLATGAEFAERYQRQALPEKIHTGLAMTIEKHGLIFLGEM